MAKYPPKAVETTGNGADEEQATLLVNPTVEEERPSAPVFKIPVETILSDDCEITIGRVIVDGEVVEEGTKIAVHLGESVDVMRIPSMRAWMALGRIDTEGLDPTAPSTLRTMEGGFDDIASDIARRITAWTWTDMGGEPLPAPYKNVDVIRALEVDELFYLMNVIAGEAPEQRGNGRGGSPGSSLTKVRPRQKSSS